MTRSTTLVRVRLADTDARGCVGDSRFLEMFEIARADAVRNRGLPYTTILARDVHALTVEANVSYLEPAREDDLLHVHCWISELSQVRFTFAYEVRLASDQALSATGTTTHICLNGQGQPMRIPSWLRTEFEHLRLS